jgi:CDP-6-deoxy-D-xylo-4-hexulose-3-dehydrase
MASNIIEEKPRKVWYSPNGLSVYGQKEITAVVNSLNDGWLAGFGPKTIEFEKKVAELYDKKFGLFVNSGSSANLLAIASLNLPHGSEIITPACTFNTTVAPIIQNSLKPIFCDVELTTYVPSVKAVIEKVNKNTRAIMIPNLIGNKPDWDTLKNELIKMGREDIYLIEDSCDTISKTKVTDISTASFYASHIITAMGSGGMVMFNNPEFLDRANIYRDWGRLSSGNNTEDVNDRFNHSVDGIPYDFKFLYGVAGYNFKSSEANAAFGLVQLEKLTNNINIRRKNIERYIENLKDCPDIILPDDSIKPCWLAVPLQYKDRHGLLTYLEENNIQTRVLFAGNITRHIAYRDNYLETFENSDMIMKNGFLLGAHNCMDIDDVDYVCNKIKEYVAKHK